MRLLFAAILLAFLAAAPASAQLHERGVARQGAALATRMGGTAVMCQSACAITGGCSGWNWTRAGVNGPQARCELMAGALQSRPDSCCNSGQSGNPSAPVAAGAAAVQANQYAGRSQTPTGPPVQLTDDPTGGIWQDTLEDSDEDEAADEESEDEGEEDQVSPGEEDEARIAAAADADAPEVTGDAPTARITSGGRPRGGGAPRYSILREYGGADAAPAQPAPPPPTGVADPSRWIGG